MVKLISFIASTHFFQFNQLKFLRQPGYLLFKLNQQYFFLQCIINLELLATVLPLFYFEKKKKKTW